MFVDPVSSEYDCLSFKNRMLSLFYGEWGQNGLIIYYYCIFFDVKQSL